MLSVHAICLVQHAMLRLPAAKDCRLGLGKLTANISAGGVQKGQGKHDATYACARLCAAEATVLSVQGIYVS